jgi:hypothetical protein
MESGGGHNGDGKGGGVAAGGVARRSGQIWGRAAGQRCGWGGGVAGRRLAGGGQSLMNWGRRALFLEVGAHGKVRQFLGKTRARN